MTWTSLTTKFGWRKEEARGNKAEETLAFAYRAVFNPKERASDEQKEIVLADLAAQSGFYAWTPSTASDQELRQNEGKRELFGRMFAYLNLSPSDIQALGNAARREMIVDNQPGFE